MIVVVNSTPLIHLSKIGKLALFQDFYSRIYISHAVYQEVVVDGERRKDALAVSQANWIEKRRVDQEYLDRLKGFLLDPGEIETIALSLQLGADLVIMDELDGREIAASFGLNVVGTVGLVEEGYRLKLIDSLRVTLDDLRNSGFFLSEKLYQAILEANK